MATTIADPEQVVARVEQLTAQLEAIPDPMARAIAEELSSRIVQMYGAGLERIVEAIADAGPAGREIQEALAADGLVASLLLIHDLYPVPVEERVLEALDKVRPYMESHGGNVELIEVSDGIARLRLEGSCKTCRASSATLELAVRQALEEAAPDLEGMDVEGIPEPEDELGGMPLPMANGNGAGAVRAWHDVDGIAALAPDDLAVAEIAGVSLVIGNVEGTLLAYRNSCAGCGGPLDEGVLTAGALVCPACTRSFFLPRAGRSLDDDRLQLEPVPCTYDMELVAAKYFYSLNDGEVPLAFNFNGTVFYEEADGRMRVSLVPWSCSAEFRLPVPVWRDLIEHYYPRMNWVTLHSDTREALEREKRRRGLPTMDACVAALLEEGS